MSKPSPLTLYPVGAALLAVFAAAAWGLLRSDHETVVALTEAARKCGFDRPRFALRDGVYAINETFVSGRPNGPVPPEGQRLFARAQLLQSKLMPCLERAAKAIGVRVSYERMVIVN